MFQFYYKVTESLLDLTKKILWRKLRTAGAAKSELMMSRARILSISLMSVTAMKMESCRFLSFLLLIGK